MNDELRELQEKLRDFYDYNGIEDDCYYALKEIVDELINTPKHETVEEWETRTGESYPDDAPVYFREENEDSKGKWYFWKLSTYKQAIPWGSDEAIKKWMEKYKDDFVVANHHGKPEIEG